MLSLHATLLHKLEDDREKTLFLGQTCSVVSDMEALEKKYEDIARRWVDRKKWFDITFPVKRRSGDCLDCGSQDFERLEGERVCMQCHTLQEDVDDTLPSSSKLGTNPRLLTFKKYLARYRGVNPVDLDDDVLTQLKSKLDVLGVTKKNIVLVLKSLGYVKECQYVNHIYSHLTGKRVDVDEDMCEKLLDDFQTLSATFDRVYTGKRRSFLNSPYVLFQLLKHLGHDCTLEDFPVIKNRKPLDVICSQLFNDLEWSFTPTC